MKWTKEQLIEGSLSLVRMKSKLAMIDHKFEKKRMELRMTFSERLDFNRKYSPLKKKIDDMDNEFLLNVAHNGVEGERDDSEPPPSNKEKQILKDTV